MCILSVTIYQFLESIITVAIIFADECDPLGSWTFDSHGERGRSLSNP